MIPSFYISYLLVLSVHPLPSFLYFYFYGIIIIYNIANFNKKIFFFPMLDFFPGCFRIEGVKLLSGIMRFKEGKGKSYTQTYPLSGLFLLTRLDAGKEITSMAIYRPGILKNK
jgi:hypothetical protein